MLLRKININSQKSVKCKKLKKSFLGNSPVRNCWKKISKIPMNMITGEHVISKSSMGFFFGFSKSFGTGKGMWRVFIKYQSVSRGTDQSSF